MTLPELIEQADRELTYPFEAWVERLWPEADRITDTVLGAVMIAEDTIDGDEEGAEKRKVVLDIVANAIDGLELNPIIKSVLRLALRGVVSNLIELFVKWLNHKFNGAWRGLSGLAPAS